MTCTETLQALKKAGTAQNRKVYARHGVIGELYGVSYAEFGKLKKKIKVDHALALALWDSGIHDARLLALMIADPEAVTQKLINTWVKDVDYGVLAGALAELVGKTALAQKNSEAWLKTKNEWKRVMGWIVLGALARSENKLPNSYFESALKVIESTLDDAHNRERYSMNNTLIGIGCRNAALKKKALAAAKRIGKVEVDHGETGCKTPAAGPYIEKTWAHQAKKKKAK